MKKLLLTSVAALFLATGMVQAETFEDSHTKDAKIRQALARCDLEVMKIELLTKTKSWDWERDQYHNQHSDFYMTCATAEGLYFNSRKVLPMLDGKPTCSDRWKQADYNFPPCWTIY
jgi:hypothetical protein